MNQLGGVGAGQSMFNGRFTQVDGVHSANNPSYYDTEVPTSTGNRLKGVGFGLTNWNGLPLFDITVLSPGHTVTYPGTSSYPIITI